MSPLSLYYKLKLLNCTQADYIWAMLLFNLRINLKIIESISSSIKNILNVTFIV